MANRILRDYTDSIAVNNLSEGAETFFIRLMTKADDFGKFHANPKLLKANLYPLKDHISEKNIIKWMDECYKNGLIVKYSVNNRDFLQIVKFGQRLRKMNSKFPDPEPFKEIVGNPLTIDRQPLTIDSNAPPETKRSRKEEETETEVEKKGKPVGFTPPLVQDVVSFFKEKNYPEELAKKAFEYYDTADWRDSQGNKVKNWKQKMLAVWMKSDSQKNNPTSKPIMQNGQFGKL